MANRHCKTELVTDYVTLDVPQNISQNIPLHVTYAGIVAAIPFGGALTHAYGSLL